MNHYGALAQEHWKTHRPSQYADLENPEWFFHDLGEQISDQVQAIRTRMESAERASLTSMSDLERIGRLNGIRKQAEEATYAELIWPEASNEDLESELEDLNPPASREDQLQALGATQDEDGGLMPADRQHPLWALWETSIQDSSTQTEKDTFNSAYRTWLTSTPELLDLV